MSEYESLREDIGLVAASLASYSHAVGTHADAVDSAVKDLWADNAELRDELHALANRVETLTRARLTEPAEVAEAVVAHTVRLRPQGLGDGAVAECTCGWRSEEMATASAALAGGHYHVQEVTR